MSDLEPIDLSDLESESTLSSHCSLVSETRFREWLLEDLEACLTDLHRLVLELRQHGREEVCRAIELIETTVGMIKLGAPAVDRTE